MPSVCCVEKCQKSLMEGGFLFPKNIGLRQKWIQAIKNGKGWGPKDKSRVCFRHFKKTDIYDGKKRIIFILYIL